MPMLCLLATQGYRDQHPCLWCSTQLLHHIFLVWSTYCPGKAYKSDIHWHRITEPIFSILPVSSNSLAVWSKLTGRKEDAANDLFTSGEIHYIVIAWAQSRSPGRKTSKIFSIIYFLLTIITQRNVTIKRYPDEV